jgi:hypothetical protein
MSIQRIQAWQCIGCGKIEAARPCIGVCQDRSVELVDGATYDAAIARIDQLEGLLRQFVMTTPREGEWAQSWRILQQRTRELLVRK